MDPYSISLAASLIAIAVGSVAVLILIFVRRGGASLVRGKAAAGSAEPPIDGRLAGLRLIAAVAASLGLLLAAISALTHVVLGHRPGTPEALRPLAFLLEHQAYVVIAALGSLTIYLSRRVGRGMS